MVGTILRKVQMSLPEHLAGSYRVAIQSGAKNATTTVRTQQHHTAIALPAPRARSLMQLGTHLQQLGNQVPAFLAHNVFPFFIQVELHIAVKDAVKDLLRSVSVEWWCTCSEN